MTPLRALRRAMDVIMPWPSKHQRKAAIRRAKREKERSRASAAHAEAVRMDIEQLAERNHFAASIARQIIDRHQQGQGST